MAPLQVAVVNELSYRALVWLTYRLAATVALGLPLVLLVWSAWRREPVVQRLLGLYWKVASLMGISLLLLTDERPLGYLTAVVAPVLMVVSVWFWVDLNEELADQPTWRALPLTVRLWRWALSGFGVISLAMTTTGLRCMESQASPDCSAWLEAPQGIHRWLKPCLISSSEVSGARPLRLSSVTWRWWPISPDCCSGCWCVCPATAVSPVSSDVRC